MNELPKRKYWVTFKKNGEQVTMICEAYSLEKCRNNVLNKYGFDIFHTLEINQMPTPV